MRTKLKTGQQISLICDGSNKIFTINRIIGDGATCIAYEASSVNSWGITEQYRIKECYPYNTDIIRNELCLNWTNEDDKTAYFTRFKNSYILMNQLKAEENIGNNITSTMLCEGNGTLYSVMDVNHATVYSKDPSKNLKRILETILVLTKVTGNLHSKGYLHLDIKPENFLVTYEPSTNIWLFDVDSLTSIEELKNGIVKTTPYSFTYAAPEQKFGETSKISPATDIYAIGAVMFEKIMGRSVSVDDIGVFAKWDLDANPIFEGINPKAKRLIKSIFKKTLAISPKRRYQNTDQLAYALENVIKAVNEKLFISSNIPANAAHFIGRETELSAIHNEFSIGHKAVFIHGFGGMGKSSLAVAYANKYKDSYDTAVFLKYRDSLKELLCEINIQNYEGADEDKLKDLPKLLDKNCLLIIDNFDIEIDQDDYLDELLQLNTNILFTTRTDFSSVYGEDIAQIEVSQLADKELLQLFKNISGDNLSTDEMISKLLLLVEGHTYAVELLALQIAASGCTIEELHNKVSNGLDELSASEKVRTRKDGRIIKRTIPEIIRTLFNVASLNEDRKQVLRNLYLLRFLYVDKELYRRFTEATATDINSLNDLTELGWVRTTYNHWYSLHPLVEELVNNDLYPSIENCSAIYNYIQKEIRKYKHFNSGSELDERSYSTSTSLICSFFNNINLYEAGNRKILLDWLLFSIADYEAENDDFCIGQIENSDYSPLYKKLELIAKTSDISPIDQFNIYYILMYAWLLEYNWTYQDFEKQERADMIREKNLKNYFELALSSSKLCDSAVIEDLLNKIYGSIFFIAGSLIIPRFPQEFIKSLYSDRPSAWPFDNPLKKSKLGLPLSIDEQQLLSEAYDQLPDVFKDDYTDEDIESEREFKNSFLTSKDKVQFVKDLAENVDSPPVIRETLIVDCKSAMFGDFQFYRWFLNFTDDDWRTVQDILSIESELLSSDDYTNSQFYNLATHNELITQNNIEQSVVYVMRGQLPLFESVMRVILQNIRAELSDCITSGWHWSKIIDMNNIHSSLFRLIRSFVNIDKESYILPYILKINYGFYEYAKVQPDFDEKMFFDNYNTIYELAESALLEKDVPEKYKLNYMDIEIEYECKMDDLSGKNFILKV